MNKISIIVRCSDDWRVFECLNSIDVECDVVIGLTPNKQIEAEIIRLGYKCAMSEKGNPAATTLSALSLLKYHRVLLIDSDCVFFPGAIARLSQISNDYDIVRPKIEFESTDFSSHLTSLARNFQYEYCGFVYEPGLVVNLEQTLPKVGGYLFSPYAPFTPDGELDFRIRSLSNGNGPSIGNDTATTLLHSSLSFRKHLFSYYRYGMSEVSRMVNLKQRVLCGIVFGFGFRYRNLLNGSYPFLTLPVIFVGDLVYITSILWHLFKARLKLLFRP